MNKEIWKNIKGYEGLYQISSCGNIKSFYKNKEKLLSPTKNSSGYYMIGLTKNKIRKFKSIHRLVAETFIPNPNDLPQVNHKDENRENNNVNNLEWCTAKYNCNYGNHCIKLSNSKKKRVLQYDLNNNFIAEYDSIKEASEQTNSNYTNIYYCCVNKRNKCNNFKWRYKN